MLPRSVRVPWAAYAAHHPPPGPAGICSPVTGCAGSVRGWELKPYAQPHEGSKSTPALHTHTPRDTPAATRPHLLTRHWLRGVACVDGNSSRTPSRTRGSKSTPALHTHTPRDTPPATRRLSSPRAPLDGDAGRVHDVENAAPAKSVAETPRVRSQAPALFCARDEMYAGGTSWCAAGSRAGASGGVPTRSHPQAASFLQIRSSTVTRRTGDKRDACAASRDYCSGTSAGGYRVMPHHLDRKPDGASCQRGESASVTACLVSLSALRM
ncbi:hypothetical protein B0H14DRAFT_810218 [Mycena olivaceomarginata]|nr:hypothetical protein B0H14DRAFT_810218 [Mycena olivaceomarginata]